ncbi:hypothetical protein N7499_005994 [Penicillium canescens]|uniref:GPI anchored protein n=1 Tax=Penicillium canescens TaxID=5083 RepID=A0AAD6ICS2_PENCN|nr:uncharacterized protein N7446_001766 [Penicillium canescens]KAJ5997611.1 hypothetical protein N7522_009271 [Penicillium canescens]KAJ6043568.1 hypothetical protein N7460_004923 [Penicillium canescens]KAJ6055042.1 hypothetical protein N7444_004140 [Penicillium canescens]KAJ6073989.1 hypothetical protein N7446_001766 [Penicillium canescens]KAJ6081120.1 hypothetical protein N7499_005994 [Penicillium canescens]
MHIASLALLAGATAVAADTVTLFLPGFDQQNLVGSVLGSSAKMTTYLVQCASGEDAEDCGVPPGGVTVIQGSSTAAISYGMEGITLDERCNYDATSVTCSGSMVESGISSALNTAVPFSEIPGGAFLPVSITATGSSSASATTGASATASTASSTGGSSMTTSVSSTATGTSTNSESNSAAATGTQTSSPNAALPMITGNARWAAAGGVAAAIAVAAL